MEPRQPSRSPGFFPFWPLLARLVGATLLAAGVTTIWESRLASHTDIYLSEMGASDAPTPLLFNSALLAIALGGCLVAIGRSGIRSGVRWLGAWSISATLVFACLSIALASRVTCSPGCPVPFTSGSTVADFVHTLAATLGFAAVGLAIIQAAYAHSLRPLFAVSIASGTLIILASGVGGLLSVFRFRADLGGWLELAAATVALLWVIVFALARIAPPPAPPAPAALAALAAPRALIQAESPAMDASSTATHLS
ncbi:hypothetical protein B7R22_10945 [Subtercola boreus]|uniref:DUF998 domain-containing protein n=1 Tax=Subtercola boreus TaxID=120213 RepID=A0A3E0VWM6_9MICO|nr:DUF998 domain-containing protein [Subtercola boreus]RFA14120.1 hypothetical protein B7R22_10945 [Subtercola boreus]